MGSMHKCGQHGMRMSGRSCVFVEQTAAPLYDVSDCTQVLMYKHAGSMEAGRARKCVAHTHAEAPGHLREAGRH